MIRTMQYKNYTQMLLNYSNFLNNPESLELFNNIGYLDGHEGRLTLTLKLFPRPQLSWEFQVARLAKESSAISLFEYMNNPPIRLCSWDLPDPALMITEIEKSLNFNINTSSLKGSARVVIEGNQDQEFHHIETFLLNTEFLRVLSLDKELTGDLTQDLCFVITPYEDRLDWMRPKLLNLGCRITAKFEISQRINDSSKLRSFTGEKGKEILSNICSMLSFANAGYIAPCIFQLSAFAEDKTESRKSWKTPKNIYTEIRTDSLQTPIENLGVSWLHNCHASDLELFLGCFSAFQKAQEKTEWRERWNLILEWYFQSLPIAKERSAARTIMVCFNSLGCLIEILAYLILVVDEPDMTQQKENTEVIQRSKDRTKVLMRRIGIELNDEEINEFVDLRNDSTHPVRKKSLSSLEEQVKILWRGIQWAEEVILWRLGYSGRYLNRQELLDKPNATNYRYDLKLRLPNW